MKARVLLSVFVSLALWMVAAPAWGQQSTASATVTVLHALPGFTADVYVNGELTLNGFEPETATDPLSLPPGDYAIDIRDVGAPADSTPALSGSVTIEAGQDLSIIAGLDEQGDPVLNVFQNDLSPVSVGKARFIVRHVADAPGLDVLLDQAPVVQDLENGQSRATQLAEGSHALTIATAGSSTALAGPMDVQFAEGTDKIVYAIGSADGDTFDLMVQTIADVQSAPPGVPTGDGGWAASRTVPGWAWPMLVAAALAVVAGLLPERTFRRRPSP
jgi:hypothetical protein